MPWSSLFYFISSCNPSILKLLTSWRSPYYLIIAHYLIAECLFLIMSLLVEDYKMLPVYAQMHFYPTALKGCRDIVFTHNVQMGGQESGKTLSGLYLRNRKM